MCREKELAGHLLGFLVLLTLVFDLGAAESPSLAQDIQARLSGRAGEPVYVAGEPIRALREVRAFYTERGHRPAWTAVGADGRLAELISAIEGLDGHGLQPDHYHLDALRRAEVLGDQTDVELLATDAYLTMAAHLAGGRLDPVSIDPDWTMKRRLLDWGGYLRNALSDDRIGESLDALPPASPEYQALRQALATYRHAVSDGGWQPIPEGGLLKHGARGPRVPMLRERLRSTRLLGSGGTETEIFDAAVEEAVAAFQRRIGLEADGIVGPDTLRELNRPPSERVAQIRANLERWRWLPDDLGRRHVRVNIADFELEAVEDGVVVRRHEVIVGQPYRMTPVFSSEIGYIVLNPWWETPHNLARLDKLPLFRRDPDAVRRLGFEVQDRDGRPLDPETIDWSDYSASRFPFRLRQRPGPHNALGQVKLMFPNKHAVYLHDTPTRDLFDRAQRTFSSGCVRVRDALDLTEWVLAETPGWARADIDAALATGEETRIDLAERVPVHILYFTAVVDPDGTLRLINDVYDRDRRLIAALAASPTTNDPQW